MYTYSLKELEKIDIAKINKKRNEDNGIFYCTKDDKEYGIQLSYDAGKYMAENDIEKEGQYQQLTLGL